jgi:enoyl-CoA hydratase/carnithine racemase
MHEIGEGTAIVEVDGHRADLWLNRPDKRNAINEQVIADLTAAIERVEDLVDEEDVRAMTLLGKGPVFCAGMDMEMMYAAEQERHDEFHVALNDLFTAIENVSVPTVAGIKRAAVAGAFELALPADFRVIGADATYGLRETKLGIFPSGGSTQRLPQLVGLARAKDLVMRSDFVDPQEAERMGLVNEVVEPGAVDEEAQSLADELATRAPLGMVAAKECLNAAFDTSLEEGLEMEHDNASEIWETHDRKEGFAAALEEREPEFEGR